MYALKAAFRLAILDLHPVKDAAYINFNRAWRLG